jgi:hypothetical protein
VLSGVCGDEAYRLNETRVVQQRLVGCGGTKEHDDLPVVVRHPVVHVEFFIAEHSNDAKCGWCVLSMHHLQWNESKKKRGERCDGFVRSCMSDNNELRARGTRISLKSSKRRSYQQQ